MKVPKCQVLVDEGVGIVDCGDLYVTWCGSGLLPKLEH